MRYVEGVIATVKKDQQHARKQQKVKTANEKALTRLKKGRPKHSALITYTGFHVEATGDRDTYRVTLKGVFSLLDLDQLVDTLDKIAAGRRAAKLLATAVCEDSPDGRHDFQPDVEYDAVDPPLNCVHCGTTPDEA
mgnify:FL=1